LLAPALKPGLRADQSYAGPLDQIGLPPNVETARMVIPRLLARRADLLAPTEPVYRKPQPPRESLADQEAMITELLAHELSACLAETHARGLWEKLQDAAGDRERFHRAALEIAARVMPAERARQLTLEIRDVLARESQATPPELEGNLQNVSIAEVLRLLDRLRLTGSMSVRYENTELDLYLLHGAIQFARAHGVNAEFLLGRYLVKNKRISRHDLEEFMHRRSGQGGLMGMELVRLGYISPRDLHDALAQQCQELTFELLRFPRGRFRFRAFRTLPGFARDAALDLPVNEVLIAGLRRVDEWRVIGEVIRDVQHVPRPLAQDQALHWNKLLDSNERKILTMIDGARSIAELAAQTELSSFEVCRVLYRLHTTGLVVLPDNESAS
ncbi:MAG: DUF4388 domain-containing protein, partial [Pseudomonadota bacterium]